MIQKYDKVGLKELTKEHMSCGFDDRVFGDVIEVNNGIAKVIFYNTKNYGDGIVREERIEDLEFLNRPTEYKMIELLDGVFSKISSSKKERFSVNQFNEYDYVELVEDRNVYSEYGLGKGSRGHILADHAVDGKILVEFIGVSDKMLEETMGLLTVDIDDLKKVEK